MDALKDTLRKQLDTAWSLADYHLKGLTDAEALWRPAVCGPHLQRTASAKWEADWPEDESYSLGPPSIAWLMWHMQFWWSMVLDHSFGSGALVRDSVKWPGSAEASRARIIELHDRWMAQIDKCSHSEMLSNSLARWPATDCSFSDIVAWVNVELMKNAAEIGYVRFLYATRVREG